MKIIEPSIEILTELDYQKMLRHLEKCARICYKSENLITQDSAEKMIRSLIKSNHTAMIEHDIVSVKWICDRGVSHEVVRSRIASYAQESTRYCNYSKEKFGNEITFIRPSFWQLGSVEYEVWKAQMVSAEKCYLDLIEKGAVAQQARSVLPNSLKTEIVITMNMREWRHFLNLRSVGTSGKPHPDMKVLADMTLREFQEKLPVLFEDLPKP